MKNLREFFKPPSGERVKPKIRKVYFGIRIRLLGLLILVMSFIITALTLIMYFNQIRLLNDEKRDKAEVLAQILGGPAEFYLDKNIKTTKQELDLKYKTIADETANFKKYNDDIVKIFLTDENGRILYSTQTEEIGKSPKLNYLSNVLIQRTEKPDFLIINSKSKDKKERKFQAITYPIFLHNGNVIDILKDFNKYYLDCHRVNRNIKNIIYLTLWQKYQAILGKEFDPKKNKDFNTVAIPSKVIKSGDIDFLFLRLFATIMEFRERRIKSGETWLWREGWLADLKNKKNKAYENDNSAEAKKADDLIMERMNNLYSKVDEVRRLGALAIIFDVDKINREFSHNINTAWQVALVILIISALIFLIVIQFMIRNLKILEKWALTVSGGNIDTQASIRSNDEIGRISDIFNQMLNELKVKFHLEKFVSISTRSMIEKAKETDATPKPGKTERRSLSFIFSDVRGFTSFSEKNDPGLVMEVLNHYMELQAKIIHSNKGDIDDYVGDQIMSHFAGKNRADKALETALEMMKAVNRFNESRKKEGLPYFEVGIGVHGGDVVAGTIGTGFRMDFTCVGDAVNLTSRLCSLAKAGEILVSEELLSQCRKNFKIIKLDPVSVKGREEAVPIAKVLF